MRTFAIAAVALLTAFVLAGCATDEEEGTGRVSFAVTDAPTDDYSYVNVTFSRAAIHRSGDGGDSDGNETEDGNETADDDGAGAGWITIVNTTRTVDLLALHRNNTAETLGFADIEAGHYQQIRFYVDAVTAVKKSDGSTVTMTVPSGVIKTSGSFTVEAGGNTTITVEIDLDQSIRCNNQGCRFTPHIGRVDVDE
ncbi:MAG: DUF4382 domain-containing protein [Candidatus Thermoplasmatota archaeon]